ncbi:ATP-binding protein [Paenibacillus alkaliterrae]|uniref:AAA family ATPase n=1 Tax=Paenibacillus alkaliterrae TaxID=320909 RepID=UPI001F2440AE|nr:ATP-binding protein [Paenibacillus alkaliterrae]MCF2939777.1 ATP-binding protein [Paenibacillus alkaliterrae]
MVASDDTKYNDHKSEVDGLSVLRCAALYGANASGKSNLIKSIDFARSLVVQEHSKRLFYKPFKLNGAQKDEPSKFQFLFIKNNTTYDYGFSMNWDRIIDEWLYRIDGSDEEILFTRSTDKDGLTTAIISDSVGNNDIKDRKKAELVSETIGVKQKKQLLLPKLAESNIKLFETVYDWFQEIVIIYPDTKFDIHEIRSLRDKQFLQFLSNAMHQLGTGINKIVYVEQDFDTNTTFADLPNELKDKIYDVISDIEEDTIAVFEISNKKHLLKREGSDIKVIKLMTKHQMDNGKFKNFEMSEESDGTQRLFDILPMIFDLYSNNRVYLIDEMDRSLHTMLSINILKQFLNDFPSDNKSQLIFTSHDTNLMDLLRDDEIWLVQKNSKHSSEIISLYDFETDDRLSLIKGYLNGRFGGVPNIKNGIFNDKKSRRV